MNCASKHGDARLGLHPAVHIVRIAAVHLPELCYQALSGHNKLLMQGSKCAIGVSPAAHGHVVCWWHSLVVQEHKKIYLGTVERIVQWMAKYTEFISEELQHIQTLELSPFHVPAGELVVAHVTACMHLHALQHEHMPEHACCQTGEPLLYFAL